MPSIVTLLTLCGRRNKQSQSPWETDNSESNFNLARVNLTHTLGNTNRSFRSNRLPFIPGRGTGSPQVTVGPYGHPLCRTYVCSATTWPYICSQCGRTPARRCVRKTKVRVVGGMSTCRADWLLGLPLYHISRHVASTFKRLATTTTHCDLNNFCPKQTG
jgi:hypothetical protein